MARMIYHVPYALDPNATSGSGIRPRRMLEAFRENGFDVELVSGDSRERSRHIRALKKRIVRGERFDFLYSESHTMPTALTDPDHLPRHPFMDVAFLAFCRRRGIRTGLFYRDVYWRFPEYRQRVNPLLHTATRALYTLDLLGYKRAVDRLYLPSLAMGAFVPHVPVDRQAALPPGGEIRDAPAAEHQGVQLFYVGGLGGYYNMHDCVRAVAASRNASLTICTRADEWEANKSGYLPLMNERITVVHEHGDGLEPYYRDADACMLFIEPSVYRSFAAPIKYAEYIGYGKPVIVNEGCNVAESVQQHGNGWAVPFEVGALTELLDRLGGSPAEISSATGTTLELREDNTWSARARQVARDLAPGA